MPEPRAGVDGRRPERIVRAPNHLGDMVLALPAMLEGGEDVMVVRWLVPVLEMAGYPGEVLPLDRGPGGFARAVRELRRRRYRSGVLLTAAFSAAWLFRCGGVRRLRGTRTDGRGPLLREHVDAARLRGMHRTEAFGRLLDRVGRGQSHPGPLAIRPPAPRVRTWRDRLPAGDPPLVAVFPGSNAPARRWPSGRFREAVGSLAASGFRVVVLGGARERGLTDRVASAAEDVLDFGGDTDVVDLAAVLSLCDLVITNDTGPMHLAGAVGTPTVSLWGSSSPLEVRQTGSPDVRVSGRELPCRPCYRNECHRRGRGTLLADAHEECMKLIEVRDVIEAVRAVLETGASRA